MDFLKKMFARDKLNMYEREHDLYLTIVQENPWCQDDKYELKLLGYIKKYQKILNELQ